MPTSSHIGGLLGIRRAANPTFRDQISQGLLGPEPSDEWRTAVSALTGSQGYGKQNFSLLDITPILGSAANGQEDWRDGNYKGVALNALGSIPAFGAANGLLSRAGGTAIPFASKLAGSAGIWLNNYLAKREER